MSKTAQNIILIHGFRGTHNGLYLIARDLSADFNCFVPDIPGFGKGPVLETYSLDEYVLWLDSYITKLNLDKNQFYLDTRLVASLLPPMQLDFLKKFLD